MTPWTNEQIKSAYDVTMSQGFGWDDWMKGAQRYGVGQDQMRAAGIYAPGTNKYTGTQVYGSNANQSYNYDDIVSRYNYLRETTGKSPALGVKSALQLGIPHEVIMSLPGMTQEYFNAGKHLIDSGAFARTATGTAADGYYGGDVDPNSDIAKSRLASGLDIYGNPAKQSVYGNPLEGVGANPSSASSAFRTARPKSYGNMLTSAGNSYGDQGASQYRNNMLADKLFPR